MQEEINYPDTFKKGYNNESEILLDPNKKYEKIDIKTPKLEKAEQDLIKTLQDKFPNYKETIKENIKVVFLKEC